MPCTKRLRLARKATGVVPLKRDAPWPSGTLERLEVACGTCLPCRLNQSRDWAVRSVHEATLHDEACFVTLTYNDAHLPPNDSLRKTELRDFLKRLRERLRPRVQKLRFVACGEYGTESKRAHYHLLLFGTDFRFDRIRRPGNHRFPLYTSPTVDGAWQGRGHAAIGAFNFQTAAYVSRYVTGKVNGKRAARHYGEREPEFLRASLKPGIASDWIAKHLHSVYPVDQVVVEGKVYPPPKYYDDQLEILDPELFDLVMQGRKERDQDHTEWTLDRLANHAKCVESRLTGLRSHL